MVEEGSRAETGSAWSTAKPALVTAGHLGDVVIKLSGVLTTVVRCGKNRLPCVIGDRFYEGITRGHSRLRD